MKLEKVTPDKEEIREKEVKQEKEVKFINSIEPKSNHKLFEFRLNPDGGYDVRQTEWKQPKELILKPNSKGVFEPWTEPVERPKIDLFNPEFKAEKQVKHNITIEEGVCYITALNYENAVKKFKQLNK